MAHARSPPQAQPRLTAPEKQFTQRREAAKEKANLRVSARTKILFTRSRGDAEKEGTHAAPEPVFAPSRLRVK